MSQLEIQLASNPTQIHNEKLGYSIHLKEVLPSNPGAETPPEETKVTVSSLAIAIEKAHQRIKEDVVRTPVIRLPWLDAPGRKVFAKLESQQHSGSFKYRGALNSLLQCQSSQVVTASAGNHALATAAAGARLDKKVNVICPQNASEIKVSRLAHVADVTVIGKDLHEATLAAKRLARSADQPMHFLSPYADPDVVAGAGTVVIEAFDDAPVQFDTVVVPLGGGGLAAAIGAYCKATSPQTRVVCTHPAIFGRDFGIDSESNRISEQLKQPTEPSVSDGLGVQLTEATPLADILDTTIDSVLQVSEEETHTGIAALLRLESLLVEGAAATTVGALLNSTNSDKITGNTLLIFSGGNIASTAVAKALVSDVSDARIRQRLGLRHIVDPVERHGALKICHASSQGWTDGDDSLSLARIWKQLTGSLRESMIELQEKAVRKTALDKHLGLDNDAWCDVVFQAISSHTSRLLDEFHTEVDTAHSDTLVPWRVEDRYRTILLLQSTMASLYERASAAYDQSRRNWFFDTGCQNSAAVNYDRYGTGGLRSVEIQLLDTLRLGPAEPVDLLLTSSGMAAFQVVQLYLLQQLQAGDVVVVSPYIYFEALEQLQALPHITLIHAPDFSTASIVRTAEENNAKVVLFDGIANIVDLPTTDVQALLRQVAQRPGWSERTIVIDGTMTSGAMRVYDWNQGPHKPTLLYYESASKYLQLGLDMQMGGLVVYPTALDQTMRTIRRNSGTIMYTRSSTLMPHLTYDMFQSRMRLMSDYAERLAATAQTALAAVADVRHPSEWQQYGWRHGGTLVTLRFFADGLNNKEGLEACIDLVLRAAERLAVPFTKGVSFGFSTARISAASSMAKDSDPFLRVNVGLPDPQARATAMDAVVEGVLQYVLQFTGRDGHVM